MAYALGGPGIASMQGAIDQVDAAQRPLGSTRFGGCVAEGEPTIAVPDVIGKPLDEAIREIKASDLWVVGNGVPNEDSVSQGAVVTAQAPPPGELVPRGACVGFRTEE